MQIFSNALYKWLRSMVIYTWQGIRVEHVSVMYVLSLKSAVCAESETSGLTAGGVGKNKKSTEFDKGVPKQR